MKLKSNYNSEIMDVSRFEDLEPEFMARVCEAVYCSMATVDRKGRPRSRILHPIWDGPIGWAISWPASHKKKHLAINPYVSLAYVHDRDKPTYADCRSEWVTDEDEKIRVWELFKNTPPPLGFDPEPHYGSIHHPYYGLLKFTPWRIELGALVGEPIIWRA